MHEFTDFSDVSVHKRHKKKAWLKEEDQILQNLVTEEGTGSWVSIAKKLPGRSGKQCRERWYNKLAPNIRTGSWTSTEDLLLIQLHSQYGNKWSQIARSLPGRPSNSVKNRWYSYLKRKSPGYLSDVGESSENVTPVSKRRLSEPGLMSYSPLSNVSSSVNQFTYHSPGFTPMSSPGFTPMSSPGFTPMSSPGFTPMSSPVMQSPVPSQSPLQTVYSNLQQYYPSEPNPFPISQHSVPARTLPITYIDSESPRVNFKSIKVDTEIGRVPDSNPPETNLLSTLSPVAQRVLQQVLQIKSVNSHSNKENDVISKSQEILSGSKTVRMNHDVDSPYKNKTSHNPPKLHQKLSSVSRISERCSLKPIPFNLTAGEPNSLQQPVSFHDYPMVDLTNFNHQQYEEPPKPVFSYPSLQRLSRRVKITFKENNTIPDSDFNSSETQENYENINPIDYNIFDQNIDDIWCTNSIWDDVNTYPC